MTSLTLARPRARLLSLVLAAAFLLGTAHGALAAGDATPADDAPVAYDLALLSPGLAELDAVGLGDLNSTGAQVMSTVPDYLLLDAPYSEADQELIDAVEDAGFVRAYYSEWADRESTENSFDGRGFTPETDVSMEIAQAGDDAGALAIWSLFDDADEDHLDDPAGLGDRSEFHAVAPEAGAGADGQPLAGVVGNVLIGDLILSIEVSTTPDSPFADDAEDLTRELTGNLVDRLTELDSLPTGTIALDTVRFDAPDLSIARDAYDLIDGQPNWATIGQSAEDRDDTAAQNEAAGMVDQYNTIHEVDWDQDRDAATQLWDFVRAFDSDDDATAWIDDTVMPYWESGGWDVEVLDDVTTPGDDAIVLEASDPDGTRFFSVAVWRDGATVHQLAIRMAGDFADRDALQAYIDVKADCLDAGDCWQARAVPDALADAIA